MTNIKDDFGSDKNEELIKELERLIVAFSSEGRTPLTMIVGYATMLSEGHLGKLTDEQLKAVKSMETGAKRVMNMTSYALDEMKMLDLVYGRKKLNIERIDIRSWIGRVIKRFSNTIEEKEQQLIINVPQPIYAKFDPHQSLRLLEYLVDNALKYSKEGSQIMISSKLQSGNVLISVLDNGIGIPEGDQPNIFENWFRGSHEIVRKEIGIGKGLFNAKRLADVLGSELGFESEEGKGSTFWFTLPLAEDEVRE